MSLLDDALRLAEFGFYVFPAGVDAKVPMDQGWQEMATRDPKRIRRWWGGSPLLGIPQSYNIGIFTGKFWTGKEDTNLLVVDVDNKKKSKGDDTVLLLELQGKELPDTYTQLTPSGGRHLVYRTTHRLGNSSHHVGPGIDTRACGGILIGHGSEVDGKLYVADFAKLAVAPKWLTDVCSEAKAKDATASIPVPVDEKYAELRALDYLEKTPGAQEGARGSSAYRIAAYLKDLGLSCHRTYELLSMEWAGKCDPPIDDGQLRFSVENAYRYGKDGIGVAAPEADFPVEKPVRPSADGVPSNPIDKLNSEYAFVLAGGGHHILWETTDAKGKFFLEHLQELSFHRKFASESWVTGDSKPELITKLWMRSKKRRSYRGFCFNPGREVPAGYYNLWRGFTEEPVDIGCPQATEAVAEFLRHIEQNICDGDPALYEYVVGWFAHLVQRPWEKPEVALVLRGEKGVGKNVVFDVIGHLLGGHYLNVANRRFLVGNFNGHLENKLLLSVDEAFWSGDKSANGVLKDVVTGKTHFIERKGQEPYTVDNLLRLAILGNEDWLVPASWDERRFAVCDVGNKRKKDRAYFGGIKEGMKTGGYSLLLHYLLDFNIANLDVSLAPETKGLLEQKHASLDPFLHWWLLCLTEGEIDQGTSSGWPVEIPRRELRDACYRSLRSRNISKWLPDERRIGRYLKDCVPSMMAGKQVTDEGRSNTYRFPTLEQAREEWNKFIGHEVEWE